MLRTANRVLGALAALAIGTGCGGGLSDAQRLWCIDHNREVLDTMDILYPSHWEGNEEAKAEALPIHRQLESGQLSRQEANRLLSEIAQRHWPAEYERGCKAAYESR